MSSPTGYSRLQIALHWIIALLIAGQFAFSDSMEGAWEAVTKGETFEPSQAIGHIIGGTLILLLALWRLAVRSRRGVPAMPETGSPVQEAIAVWTHRLLYALMIAMPLSGIAAWFGGVTSAADAHGIFFGLFALLIILHITAAFFHQLVLKNGLIRRMMKAG